MMCYRDMTFCKASHCATFKTCPRALNKEVIAAAKKWWGPNGDAPICAYTEPEKLACFVAKKKKQ